MTSSDDDDTSRKDAYMVYIVKALDAKFPKTGTSAAKVQYRQELCDEAGIDVHEFKQNSQRIRKIIKNRAPEPATIYSAPSDASTISSGTGESTHTIQSFSAFGNLSITSIAEIPSFHSVSTCEEVDLSVATAVEIETTNTNPPLNAVEEHVSRAGTENVVAILNGEGRKAAASIVDAGQKPKNGRTSLANVIRESFGTVHSKLQKEKAKEEVEKQKLGNKILGYMGDFIDGERVKKQLENEQLRKKTKATKKEE